MSPVFVDVYALALRALDPAAWELFAALEDRILHSAACLLGHAELTALRPAVMNGVTPVSPAASSYVQPVMATAAPGAGASSATSVAAEVLQYLRKTLQAGILHTVEMTLDSPTMSAPERLVKDLSRVRQVITSAPSPSSTRCPGLVLTELSVRSQGILVLSALWMSTKLWATLSETSTLSGLLACFLRLTFSTKEPTVAVANLDGGTPEPASGSEPGPGKPDAPDALPVEQANTGALCLASTPPSSPLASVPPQPRWRAEISSIRLGATSQRAGDDPCGSGERIVTSCGDIALDPMAHLTSPDGGIPEAAEWLARDVEEAEMILLRCSDYIIPI
ncbi:hypothetical protein LSCM1_06617 [Leishmania martiniquensis]|uniref:Uncharacterized protein n=1 Tax=Leishmania martiniquensis TaxID=1580590 RepID=A0A836KS18_9TRYP|nr:hypothetical protein LSCM1_06617 [Leishmania martiniquensis]